MSRSYIKPYPLGAHAEDGGVRFAFHSADRDCGILIYDKRTGKKLKRIAFEPDERIGDIYCKYVSDVDADRISYQFYEGGEIIPDCYGRSFNRKNGYGREYKECDLRAMIPTEGFDWEEDCRPHLLYSESICYCAHVRGFTRHRSSGVAHGGTFLGLAEKLDYLQEIGITTVELQPVYEFAELPTPEERQRILGGCTAEHMISPEEMDAMFPRKCNYWGYKRGYYYAPKAAYASSENVMDEFKQMVKEFHRRGMEIVLQFYFPNEIKRLEIPYILRYWVLEYHVDGFHLMGENLPAELIASDPMLTDTKLWYYYFDTDAIYGKNGFPARKNLAVCQDDYLYTMRSYLKGDENMLGSCLDQMRLVPEKTGRIHYMTNYYGFTMMDMVSYDRKHNEANGEDNRDGNDHNCSWNCGEEGKSRRRKIVELRHRQIKNAMLLLLFSQSTPMIFMGDEFGNSQRGNNNPYCQDNLVTWLDWNDRVKNEDIFLFWKQLVELRKSHPILHPGRGLKVMDYISCGYPDLSYHGQNAWRPRLESYNRHVGVMFCGKYAKIDRTKEDDFFYLALNMYWEDRGLALPKLPRGLKWKLCLGTAMEETDEISAEGFVTVHARSIAVYISVPDESQTGGRAVVAEDYSDRTAF